MVNNFDAPFTSPKKFQAVLLNLLRAELLGAPVNRPAMGAFNDVVWAGVQALAPKYDMKFAFVDASTLFEGVRADMASFG